MLKAIRILLVEIYPSDADLICEELQRGGIQYVSQSVSGKAKFLPAIEDFRPELILTDCHSPGFDGFEAVSLAREHSPDVPVIVISESPEDGMALETIKRGATDYIVRNHVSQIVPAVLRAVREANERKQRRRAEVLLEVKYQQLRLQNEALQQSEERFRQLAESIREVFWMTDLETGQMLYISPAYEEIWGRTCASLRASPSNWLDTIHPEDRARIAGTVRTTQIAGEYDEHYRILRPDGTMRWIHDRAFPVRDEHGNVYRIAGVAEDITNRKLLERQVLEVSDREQARIGCDLHDGLCQLLVSIGFNVNSLKQDLETDLREEAASAGRIGLKLTDAIKMARHIAQGLSPINFHTENLATALDHLARNTSSDYGVLVAAETPGAECVTDSAAATHVYRIAQEAVHNAVKHAKPTNVLIRLTADAKQILLTVADDGCGIGSSGLSSPGMGRQIMKYRAGMLFGALEIRALNGTEGRGTLVSCSFPRNASNSSSGPVTNGES